MSFPHCDPFPPLSKPQSKGPFYLPITLGVLTKGPYLFIDFWNNKQLTLGGGY